MEESMTHSYTLRVLAVVFVLCLFLSGCVPAEAAAFLPSSSRSPRLSP